MPLTFERCLELVAEQSAALAAAVGTGELTDAVPSCPGWTARDLITHHGNVLRVWASVAEAAEPAAPADWMTDDDATPPWDGPGADVQPWYVACRRTFAETFAGTGPDGAAWTWWGEPNTTRAIARHQVQEAAVHRWDAQVAAGLDGAPLPHDAAVDGVEEFLTVSLPAGAPPWDRAPVSVGLRADGVRPWLLAGGGGAVTARPYDPDVTTPAATVTATASDLVLLLYGRIAVRRLDVTGDRDSAALLLDNPQD